jgi:hypothetical protein
VGECWERTSENVAGYLVEPVEHVGNVLIERVASSVFGVAIVY